MNPDTYNPFADIFAPPAPVKPLSIGQQVRFDFPSTYPAKLLRIRQGVITFLNGWKNVDRNMASVERSARDGDQKGDVYLLLDVVTGEVIRHFKLELPVPAEKEIVEL